MMAARRGGTPVQGWDPSAASSACPLPEMDTSKQDPETLTCEGGATLHVVLGNGS